MKVVIGYVLAVIGLVLLSFGAGGFTIPLISSLPTSVVNIAAMVLVGVGVVIVIISGEGSSSGGGFLSGIFGGGKYPGKRKSKRGGKIKDLPVYEGDDIVAYRRD